MTLKKSVKPQAGIQSVEVGFALLEALAAQAQAMMLRDLAAAAQMSPAKAHRYLVSYQRLELVEQDTLSRYSLGAAALRLGLAALSRLDAVQLARAQMDALMQDIGHTVALAVWGNHGPVIVHWQEPARAVTANLRLGDVMPLLSSATGRCFAAFYSAAQVTPLLKAQLATLARDKSAHADVPRNEAQAKALLLDVKKHGAARVMDVLVPGISSFAVPVFDASGHMALCLVSLGASNNFDATWQGGVARSLKRCAQDLARRLGAA